ncbi:DUF6520 family protein [Flavobacterium sp. HJSW_4]|uniref:DUF6520 family protein n=1 Tax=Flavobacterium sp. HJSW_4 TaxID=3344660 RepID=UPI0035F288DF
MKSLFLKNMVPIAVVAFGISGAFLTTSMQSASKSESAPKVGYLRNADNSCQQTPVNCDDTPSQFVCRLNITSGPQAYDKDADNNCINTLYRPN